jgi:hypothetical protein
MGHGTYRGWRRELGRPSPARQPANFAAGAWRPITGDPWEVDGWPGGRPRPVPGGGSTRCMARSAAGTSRGTPGPRCPATNDAPGIDKVTLAAVEEYGVAWLLDELASELGEKRYRPLPARRAMIPKPGAGGTEAVVGSRYAIRSCRPQRRSSSSRSSRRASCRAASGSAGSAQRTMLYRCSSMRAGGAAGGWPRRTTPSVSWQSRMRS